MTTRYSVVSGEMWEVVPVLDDGTGPREYFRDYVEVKAREPIEARVKAVRTKAFRSWRKWADEADQSPYTRLTVRKLREGE
jgi:hypothetical protein